MKKKFLTIFIIFVIAIFLFVFSNKEIENEDNGKETTNQTVQIDLFYLPTCPHCHDEIDFLNEIKTEYPQLKVNLYSAAESKNAELLANKYREYDVPENVWGRVPVTFFERGIYIVGFEKTTTGPRIESYIIQIIEDKKDIEVIPPKENGDIDDKTVVIDDKRKINIPFIGEIDVFGYSPLVLAIILGTLDGFNPCAMTALLFLLAALIASGVKKRLILIGGTFIFISGLVYFFFIAAWFNLFLALAYFKFITTIVGIFVIFFAFTILKEYYSGVICKLCETEAKKDFISNFQKKLLLKMEKVTRAEVPLFFSLLSVAIIAVGVNTVELFCSMGFPAVFTKTLVDLGLSKASFYSHLFVYIFFYMLDDLIIFLIAIKTLSITQSSQKYLGFIKLISGILLLILGILLLVKPDFLILA